MTYGCRVYRFYFNWNTRTRGYQLINKILNITKFEFWILYNVSYPFLQIFSAAKIEKTNLWLVLNPLTNKKFLAFTPCRFFACHIYIIVLKTSQSYTHKKIGLSFPQRNLCWQIRSQASQGRRGGFGCEEGFIIPCSQKSLNAEKKEFE